MHLVGRYRNSSSSCLLSRSNGKLHVHIHVHEPVINRLFKFQHVRMFLWLSW